MTANPNNSAQLSRGRARLRNATGTYIHTQGTITPVTLTQSGTETINGVDRYIYTLKYESSAIDQTTFASSVLVQVAGFIYTDCPDVPTITIPYSDSYSAVTGGIGYLCNRTDKIWVNPPTWNSNGTMNTFGSFAGVNAFTTCTDGNYVDDQYVKVVGSGGTAYDAPITAFDIVNLTNPAILPQGSTVTFEYYNDYGCSNPPHITEVWTNW